MLNFTISSSFDGYKKEANATWNSIKVNLDNLIDSDGDIRLSVIDPPHTGPQSISVRAQNNNYLVTLVDFISEEEDEVRSYFNPEVISHDPMINIFGDYWSSKMVIHDINLVVSIFQEFYDTGDVSKDILS